jgi:hypothetical protein
VEIEVHGGGEILTGGSISLQAESHPLEFRKKDDPGSCRYE